MNKHSVLCNFIYKNKNTWKELLSARPYFLIIKQKGPFAIFNYNILAEEFVFKKPDIQITKWSDKISYDSGSKCYDQASMFAPDGNIYEQGAYMDPDGNIVGMIAECERFSCDFFLPEVQEARGIIINVETCEVVCWPFRKFGNYGERYADKIDWSSARVQEKIDGSIIKLWFNPETSWWQVSTNGMIDANESNAGVSGKTFAQLFLSAAEKRGLDYGKLVPFNTYIFELVGPFNRVVIKYDEADIYHIGTRNNVTGQEINENIGIKKPEEYDLHCMEACQVAAEKLNIGSEICKEGFVVVDKNWNRVKIKSPKYVEAHYLATEGNLSKKNIMQMILDNEYEEFLVYHPQYQEVFDKAVQSFEILKKEINKVIVKADEIVANNPGVSDKELAILITSELGEKSGWAFSHIQCGYDVNGIIKNRMTMRNLISRVFNQNTL